MGVSVLAYCMPSISFLPPEAESPVEGSKTPMRITLSPLCAAGAVASGLPDSGAALEGGVLEQPARMVRAREQERANARNFFMFTDPPCPFYG